MHPNTITIIELMNSVRWVSSADLSMLTFKNAICYYIRPNYNNYWSKLVAALKYTNLFKKGMQRKKSFPWLGIYFNYADHHSRINYCCISALIRVSGVVEMPQLIVCAETASIDVSLNPFNQPELLKENIVMKP